jgi:ABC-type sulfate transport system substrate-binding protein
MDYILYQKKQAKIQFLKIKKFIKKSYYRALESEVYKKIKENFPDAELSEVEEVK